MSISKSVLLCSWFVLGVNADDSLGRSAGDPGLGVPIEASHVKALDYVVLPNGDGLPLGGGSAVEGARIYSEYCEACHGKEGAGKPNDRLSGGIGSIGSESPLRTVGSYWPYATTVFDYVRRAMPYVSPGTLTNNELYAVTAYILNVNGVTERDEWMDADSLPRVTMPNRQGFESAYKKE